MRQSLEVAKKLFKGRNDIIGVEIGVDQGINAIDILEHWKSVSLLHLIDNYVNSEIYSDHLKDLKTARKRLKKYEDRISWHIIDSVLASCLFDNASLDFVYIDGNHLYPFVLLDMDAWTPKIKKGGLLCGHDYDKESHYDGIIESVDEFVEENKLKLHTKQNVGEHGELAKEKTDWWIYL